MPASGRTLARPPAAPTSGALRQSRPASGCTLPANAGVDLASADLERRFTALLDAHGPSLARLAGSYIRDRGERDDLFQEIA
ncbi:MAG TPA: hypothetical protein VF424_11430, partial [Vicinamibacterales bacterium]